MDQDSAAAQPETAMEAHETALRNFKPAPEEKPGRGRHSRVRSAGATETEFSKTTGLEKTPLFANTTLASAAKVARQGHEGMPAGALDVIAGLTFGQKMLLAAGAVPQHPRRAEARPGLQSAEDRDEPVPGGPIHSCVPAER